MIIPLLFIACGVVLLVVGADALVSGASRIARRFGIPPLIIGLTIVAIGTSTPEIVVSTTAALGGSTELALGNVVGSNIFNVLLILGLSAVILPLSVQVSLIRQEVPVMVGFSLLLFALLLDGSLSSIESGSLLLLGIGYLLMLLVQARRAARAGQELAGLVAPEGLAAPARLLSFDLPFMLVVAVALLPLIFTGYEVSRVEGAVLLTWCVVYLAWTALAATGSPMQVPLSRIALFGLLPASAAFLVATVVIALRDPKHLSRRRP